jgi:integrase
VAPEGRGTRRTAAHERHVLARVPCLSVAAGHRIAPYGQLRFAQPKVILTQFTNGRDASARVRREERVSPRTFRHTCATKLLRETGNLRLVQVALGHSSVSTTQRYTHIAAADLEQAMSVRPRLFQQAVSTL